MDRSLIPISENGLKIFKKYKQAFEKHIDKYELMFYTCSTKENKEYATSCLEMRIIMEEILEEYYRNDAEKLHRVVDRILLKWGGLSDKDKDDFYSLANEVFVEVMERYDRSQSFDGFLYSCLSNRIKTEMTRRNSVKRTADRMTVSLDMPVEDGEDSTIGDMIADSFDLEKEVLGEDGADHSKLEKYLARLSRHQRRVAQLLAQDYGPGEIQKRLGMTQREYSDAMIGIHAYENISVLF